jgi:hypothetical protein
VPKFAGSNPAKAVRIFQGEKILSTPSFGGEVKPFVPCCRFAACKRSLNVTWKLAFQQKLPANILAHSSTFRCWDLSRYMDVEASGGESGNVYNHRGIRVIQ